VEPGRSGLNANARPFGATALGRSLSAAAHVAAVTSLVATEAAAAAGETLALEAAAVTEALRYAATILNFAPTTCRVGARAGVAHAAAGAGAPATIG
jgi:hypothetical protein